MLGVTAAVAVAAAASVALIGRSSSPKHNAVAAYIKSVDGVQQQMQAQLTKTVAAYRSFSKSGTPTTTLTPQLTQADLTLRLLQRRLVALPAPVPARHLRKLLLRLTGIEVGVAHEVAQLSAFTPAIFGSSEGGESCEHRAFPRARSREAACRRTRSAARASRSKPPRRRSTQPRPQLRHSKRTPWTSTTQRPRSWRVGCARSIHLSS